MKRSKKSANPFYMLLVLAGIAFVVTTTTYYVMISRVTVAGGIPASEHPLTRWMDLHGMSLLLAELALLVISTFGAIGTDSYWQRRDMEKHQAATGGRGTTPPAE